jgi:hypothetical protein
MISRSLRDQFLTKWIVAAICAFGSFLTHSANAKSMNLSLNPFSLLSGGINTGIEFKLNDQLTAGPYVNYQQTANSDDEVRTVGFGARVDYALQSSAFEDGWYSSFFLSRYSFSGKIKGDTQSEPSLKIAYDFDSTNVGALIGYGWYWLSGFNLRLGIGLMHSTLTGLDSFNDSLNPNQVRYPVSKIILLTSLFVNEVYTLRA